MKIIKFTINESYYNIFKEICTEQDITIKKKLNILLSQDTDVTDIRAFYPSDHSVNSKSVTLKINEELYKGIMKKCGLLDLRPSKYVPYLIYRHLQKVKS